MPFCVTLQDTSWDCWLCSFVLFKAVGNVATLGVGWLIFIALLLILIHLPEVLLSSFSLNDITSLSGGFGNSRVFC